MTQRKLTREELQDVENAVRYLRRGLSLGCHVVYASIVLDGLIAIAEYGTSDGKPWQEPQPEIGEGYRVATAGDAQRRDREIWDGECWQLARIGLVVYGEVYRVPVDRIPTDEDAKARPTVMVRDNPKCSWQPAKLLGVVLESLYPFACDLSGSTTAFTEARFPYPGELP